jgi:hypothetical protein
MQDPNLPRIFLLGLTGWLCGFGFLAYGSLEGILFPQSDWWYTWTGFLFQYLQLFLWTRIPIEVYKPIVLGPEWLRVKLLLHFINVLAAIDVIQMLGINPWGHRAFWDEVVCVIVGAAVVRWMVYPSLLKKVNLQEQRRSERDMWTIM